MNLKSLKNLEYYKITKQLANIAVSTVAKEVCENLLPFDDLFEITEAQNETTDAANCVLKYGTIPLGGVSDVRPSVTRAAFGGVLSAGELIRIADCLNVVRKVKQYGEFEGNGDVYKCLDPYFESLIEIKGLQSEIERCIISENEIADGASDALRSVRREIKVLNDKIIHSPHYKTMLQDDLVTTRGGRYCVPVKQEYKNSFEGMVHDQSNGGATFFIEPIAVFNINNAIRECEIKEKREIEKILRELSESVAENADYLEANMESLFKLDFMFAKGLLSVNMKASKPVFNNKRYINIKKARHPLLNTTDIVPTDIYLGGEFTALLITGPNTGGKTVALKTLGLFTLMGQAGLHIPAYDNSELGVFDSVFSDIGDEQSIEQNLSTFSSHISNIIGILEEVTEYSLVLFDELGAGTDPTEGAALAMSIIESLRARKIRTAVTTHYSELKVFAISTEGIINASCEFDTESLKPTYRLLIGIPGKSNAFAIAKRLGMDDSVIDMAKQFISHENVKFEDVITDIEITKKSVEVERKKAEDYRIEAERYRRDLKEQKEKTQKARDKILEAAKNEAYEITLNANREAEQLIKQMKEEMKKAVLSAESRGLVDEGRKKLNEKLEETYENAHSKRERGVRPKSLKEGDRVFVLSFKQPGVALGCPDKNGDVKVLMGNMKIDINVDNLETDDNVYKEKESYVSYGKNIKAAKASKVSTEIDLRGQTSEEALLNASKYIDDAYLAGVRSVCLIHGKGTGVLRAAVHKMLAKNANVEGFRVGGFGEGENGVTIVTVRE